MVRTDDGSWPKICACGAVWSAAAWQTLPLVGAMQDDEGDLELRTCTCNSTIAVLLTPPPGAEPER